MYLGHGTARVWASIDVHGDTKMTCIVDKNGDVEVGFGDDAPSCLMLTRAGAKKLVDVLTDAGLVPASGTVSAP